MITLFWAILLGIVQGVTEFFPVSSSGHLSVLPFLLKFEDPGLAFDIALHVGTFFAILFALKDEWLAITKSVLTLKKDNNLKLLLFLILTAIPGAFFGVLLEEKAETVFRHPLITAAALIIFGFILVLVDQLVKNNEPMEKMTPKKALIVGFSQALALVPGVSRSGATITAGRASGLSREAAVKYSFLAALPIIAGASVFGLRDVQVSTLFSTTWVFGFLASFLASFLAIKFLLNYVKKNDFKLFLYWRLALGLLIFIIYFVRS